jgi:Tol biopolymer transport system component
MTTVGLLVVVSITAGLHVPETQYLSGYPSAAALVVGRPAGAFAPLSSRFIADVLGFETTGSPSAVRAASRDDVGRAAVPAPRRVSVSHPFTNDSFASAYPIPTVPFTARTDTRSATREANEPTSCSGVGGTSWYRFTATRDRALFATTFGSNHAAAVAVFSGDRLGALTQLGCHSSPAGDAQVGFPGRIGQTYYFQVTGVAGGGNTVFNLDPLGRTERVSVSSSGEQSNDYSYNPVISASGRFIAFQSLADNLTPDAPRCTRPGGVAQLRTGSCTIQVFVHDRSAHTTTLVSVSSGGRPGNDLSAVGAISGDGRFVAFQSYATNLGPSRRPAGQIYVRDRLTGTTELVSESAAVAGAGGSGTSSLPSMSADGRYVAFTSFALDLTAERPPAGECAGSGNPCRSQIYVRDRLTRKTVRASTGRSGEWGSGSSRGAAISADGGVVGFRSFATNLVAQDTDAMQDVFIRDLRRGITELISLSTTGQKGNADSGNVNDGPPAAGYKGPGYVSADGRYVAFQSEATNLVVDDTNGASDFFVRDRSLGTTVRISVATSGAQGMPHAGTPISTAGGVAISSDGRYAAFDSGLLYPGEDPNHGVAERTHHQNVYVRDIVRGVTLRVSVSSLGEGGDWHSMNPALSATGEFVVFSSAAKNLVDKDTNVGCIAPANTTDSCSDIFVHELTEYTRPG